MNILVVEDDKFLTDLIVQKLAREKFDVRVVVDVQEGLKAIKESPPHLILLDLILPGLDGFEFLSLLKKSSQTSSIPVIVLSNLSDKEYIERATALGAVDFIVKADFSLSGIVAKIKKISQEERLN